MRVGESGCNQYIKPITRVQIHSKKKKKGEREEPKKGEKKKEEEEKKKEEGLWIVVCLHGNQVFFSSLSLFYCPWT